MPKADSEEAQRRLHKILGLYLALHTWCDGGDAVAISREPLMASLGVSTLHRSRVERFSADNEHLFPYFEPIELNRMIQGMVLSRKEIPRKWGWLGGSAERAAKALLEADLQTVLCTVPSEQDAIEYLTLISHGLGDFG